MNKNIKKIIAMTLTLCAVSAVCGVKNLNLSGKELLLLLLQIRAV